MTREERTEQRINLERSAAGRSREHRGVAHRVRSHELGECGNRHHLSHPALRLGSASVGVGGVFPREPPRSLRDDLSDGLHGHEEAKRGERRSKVAERADRLHHRRELVDHWAQHLLQPLVPESGCELGEEAVRELAGFPRGGCIEHGIEELQHAPALRGLRLREHVRHRRVEEQSAVVDAKLQALAKSGRGALGEIGVARVQSPRLFAAPMVRSEQPCHRCGLRVRLPPLRHILGGR